MRVALCADFSRFTGYGNDAIDLAVAMEGHGVDVVPMPRSVTPGLPRSLTRLLEKDPTRARPDVALVFMEPKGVDRSRMQNLGPAVVLYTMWEWTRVVPDDFNDRAEFDLSWLDDLVVTCPMNVEAFRDCRPDGGIGVVPAGVDVKFWSGKERTGRPCGRPLRFLMVGVLSERKNPFAVLETWRYLKGAYPEFDAELVVHSMGRNMHPGIEEAYGPGVTLSDRPLSRDDVRDLYLSCDVLVTASRGEGNNKPAMEFMATGGPVIASDWSGHQNFMHRDLGWLVPGGTVPFHGGPAEWFEVDREALGEAMLEANDRRHVTAIKGEVAGRHMGSFTWEEAAGRMIRRLAAARG